MANYTWLGNLCGTQGGYSISKGVFDGLVGSLIDGNNLYSGKIIRDAAVAAPVTCDFPGNTYMTSAELKDGTYDRYNYSREHDFNVICIPGIDVHVITDQNQEYYAFYNGECTKAGSVFSQIVESVPATAQDFPFSYTLGCDEEDLEYLPGNIDINASGTQPESADVPARIVAGMQAYIPVSALNMPYNDYTYAVPCVRQMRDTFFAAYMNDSTGNNGVLLLYEYDFATETIIQRDSYSLGTFLIAGQGDYHPVSNAMLEWDDAGNRLFLGDMLYTGSKPNQGRVIVFDVDLTLKTITFSSYLNAPSPARYGFFGVSLTFDGGPNGTGQLIVGEPGANHIRCFDGATLAQLGASFTISKGEIGRGVCAENGVLGYTSSDGIAAGKFGVWRAAWGPGVWLTGVQGSTISTTTEIMGAMCVSKFTNPLTGLKQPWIAVRNLNQGWYYFSDYGPYYLATTTPRMYSHTDIPIDGNSYSFGRYTASTSLYRTNQYSGLGWWDDASYETMTVTPSQTAGMDPNCCVGVVNPLDTTEMRALFFYVGGSAVGWGLYVDIVDVGMGVLPGFIPGNFYLKHMVDVSLWANINSASQVSSTGTDDDLRWVVSTDNGVTWYTVQTPGGGLVQMTSFEDGYVNGGPMTTFASDLSVVDVLAAQYLTIGFMLVSGAYGLDAPTMASISMNYDLILGDPEFVLNHTTSDFKGKIEHQCTQANTWHYVYVVTEAPVNVDHCTLMMSSRTSAYTSLYGI